MYAGAALLTLGFQSYVRLDQCSGTMPCTISLARGAVWSTIWRSLGRSMPQVSSTVIEGTCRCNAVQRVGYTGCNIELIMQFLEHRNRFQRSLLRLSLAAHGA
jgi:hypothetical protein